MAAFVSWLLFCALLCLGTMTIDGKCDAGWSYFEKELVCLKWFDQLKTQEEAKHACAELDGATFFKTSNPPAAYDFLKSILPKKQGRNSIWFGMMGRSPRLLYIHANVENPFLMPNIPDKKGCSSAVFYDDGRWDLKSCESDHGFICEQPGECESDHGFICEQPEISYSCPSGWMHYSDDEDTPKCYKLFEDKTCFTTAVERCKDVTNGKGGLLKIMSNKLNDVIKEQVKEGKDYRIGVQVIKGEFSFTDGSCSSQFKFGNWQPWKVLGKTDCFELFYSHHYWHVRRAFCGSPYQNGYICKRPRQE